MSARDLAGLALLLAGGAALLRLTLPDDPQKPPTARKTAVPSIVPNSYAAGVVARESGGDAAAKNPRSSASGKYQFTRDTWRSVGGAWGPDPSKPFGGLAPSVAEQDARFATLTRSNASILARAGVAVNNASLYAAHFLGVGQAAKVLKAAPSTSLASLVGSKVIAANPHLKGFTVAAFRSWLGGRA